MAITSSPKLSLITGQAPGNITQIKRDAKTFQQQSEIRDLTIQQERNKIQMQNHLAELQRTAEYNRDTVQPLLDQGRTDELKQNFVQRIQQLDQQGRDSSGTRKALDLLNQGNIGELRRISDNVIRVAQDHKVLPETYSNVYENGKIVAQKSDVTGQESTSPRAGADMKGKRVNAQLPNGDIVPAIQDQQGHLLHPATGERMPNALIAPTRQQTSNVKDFRSASQKGKDQQAMRDAKIALTQNLRDMSKLSELIKSPDFIGGTAGQATNIVNSLFAQARQLTGSDPLIVNGKLNLAEFEKGVNQDTLTRFRKAAINNNRFESAILELAFLKAKALNPDGKISDADVRAAEDILGTGADKAARLAVLRDIMERAVAHYNIQAQYTDPQNYKPVTANEILGISEPAKNTPGQAPQESPEDQANRLLKDAGLD